MATVQHFSFYTTGILPRWETAIKSLKKKKKKKKKKKDLTKSGSRFIMSKLTVIINTRWIGLSIFESNEGMMQTTRNVLNVLSFVFKWYG